jgi:hypothetical protein
MEFVELVWGDGKTSGRQVLPATDLLPFDPAGKKWTPCAAWDSAGQRRADAASAPEKAIRCAAAAAQVARLSQRPGFPIHVEWILMRASRGDGH